MVTDKNNLLVAVCGFAVFFTLVSVVEKNPVAFVLCLICWLVLGAVFVGMEN